MMKTRLAAILDVIEDEFGECPECGAKTEITPMNHPRHYSLLQSLFVQSAGGIQR